MRMDSAMDSLSTTSDHSVASSNGSSHRHRSRSPDDHHERNGHNLSMNKRTPTPGASPRHYRPASSPLTSGGPQMMAMPHPLSPPQVSTPSNLVGMPPRIVQSLSHLPPHGLGLLNSLQMMHHASPLDLMAAAHHHGPPRSYNSPPPISSSDPTANECKLVDYRGQKVAAFMIQGESMLCLPQAFELFLKHLVGGLHTVYTKLKRLDIVPLVCNVEQVRILRGLGAIQPGVNRCKLLSCKDFDVLYRDCTTARCLSIKPPESSRPGRPPKRGPVGLSLQPSNYSHPQLQKKHRMDNGDYGGYENGHINVECRDRDVAAVRDIISANISRLDKSPLLANGYNAPPTHMNHLPFMHHPGNPHALMSPGMPPHGIPRPEGSIIKGQNLPPTIEAMARSGIWENCRAAYEDIVKHLERFREERGEDAKILRDGCRDRDPSNHGSSNGHSPVLNLSKSVTAEHGSAGDQSDRSEAHTPVSAHGDRDDDNMSDGNATDADDGNVKEEDVSDVERETATPPQSSALNSDLENRQSALNYSSIVAASAAGATNSSSDPSISSTETLLRNIQGLLKVAADNARQQERQITYEKAELKMDVLREREMKDSLDRQLTEERKLRGLYQKRLKREKRASARLREQLEGEIKKRMQLEEALKASGANAETLRLIAGKDAEHRNSDRNERESRNSSNNSGNNSNNNNNNNNNIEPKSERSGSRPSSYEVPSTAHPDPKWNYSANLQDAMATGAFWQSYSESIAQELEMDRKSRQSSSETRDSRDRDINESSSTSVKSSLSDRPNFFKNPVLYSSAT